MAPPGEPSPFWKAIGADRPSWISLALFAAIAVLAGWKFDTDAPGALSAGLGAALGCVLAAAARTASAARPAPTALPIVPLAFATAAVALAPLVHGGTLSQTHFGLCVGAVAGAYLLAADSWAVRASILVVLLVAANELGMASRGQSVGQTGSVLGLAASVGGVLASAAAELVRRQRGSAGVSTLGAGWGMAALFAGGSLLLAQRYLYVQSVGNLAAASIGAALVVHWLLASQENDESGFRFTLASVVWVALATLAFGIDRGFGMAVSLLAAGAMLVALGNIRGLLSLGAVAGLVLYRVFRETHADTSRAFDIGQHYAIIGLLLGVLLPLAFVAWLPKGSASKGRLAAATLLAVVLFHGLAVASAVFLGAKGVVGLLVGLGLAAFAEGFRGGTRPAVLAMGGSACAALLVGYGWLGPWLDLARDEKLPLLGWIAGVAVVAAIVILLLGRPEKEEAAS
ncbi:MAG: hypothetical protein M9921_03915 [Fimbriimonadaceae bacterium]|nr:hypothetical protein [Fimbriimonadaceae bacterium]